MAVSIEEIKKLKELTGLGLTDAKKALVEADGDFDKALEALRKKGLTKAEKRVIVKLVKVWLKLTFTVVELVLLLKLTVKPTLLREQKTSRISHTKLRCKLLLWLQFYASEADIPEEEIARVKAEAEERVAKENKPADIAAKIVEGQVKKYFAEKVLSFTSLHHG